MHLLWDTYMYEIRTKARRTYTIITWKNQSSCKNINVPALIFLIDDWPRQTKINVKRPKITWIGKVRIPGINNCNIIGNDFIFPKSIYIAPSLKSPGHFKDVTIHNRSRFFADSNKIE